MRLTRRQHEDLERLSQEFKVSKARLLRDAIELGFEPMVRRLCGDGGRADEADSLNRRRRAGDGFG